MVIPLTIEAALIVFSWYKYYFWTITQSLCTKSEQIMEIHVHWEQWEQKMGLFLGFNWTPIFSDVDFYKNAFAKNIYKQIATLNTFLHNSILH